MIQERRELLSTPSVSMWRTDVTDENMGCLITTWRNPNQTLDRRAPTIVCGYCGCRVDGRIVLHVHGGKRDGDIGQVLILNPVYNLLHFDQR